MRHGQRPLMFQGLFSFSKAARSRLNTTIKEKSAQTGGFMRADLVLVYPRDRVMVIDRLEKT